jgi:hypothetical protein
MLSTVDDESETAEFDVPVVVLVLLELYRLQQHLERVRCALDNVFHH